MESKLVSISLLTYNSAKYIEACLRSIEKQTYQNVEVLVIDNKSIDDTAGKIRNSKFEIRNFRFIENSINLGYTGGHNIGIRKSRGEYVILLNPDIILDKDFVKQMIAPFEKNSEIGSVQAKVYQLNNGQKTRIIDTIGFSVFESGRIIDTGQGEDDSSTLLGTSREIFGVNGVAPAYRREALNDVKLEEEYLDEDLFCYVEDIDLAWRMRWRGWKAVFNPQAILWHDRTSSKSISGGWKEFRNTRKSQSLWVRRISWRNMWFLFLKNLPFTSFFKLSFLKRQIKFFFYLLFFEPKVLLAMFKIIRFLPRMLRKRKVIMSSRKIDLIC